MGCLTSIGPNPVEDGPLAAGAVADDLAAPGLNGPGQHLAGSPPANPREDVAAVEQWHEADVGGKLTPGGIPLCLVGKFGVGDASPKYAALLLISIHEIRQ